MSPEDTADPAIRKLVAPVALLALAAAENAGAQWARHPNPLANYPLPRGYRLEAHLEIQMDSDRVTARVLNASGRELELDTKTVHPYSVRLGVHEVHPDDCREPEGEEEIKMKGAVFSPGLRCDIPYVSLKNSPVRLAPGEYLGRSYRFSRLDFAGPLRAALSKPTASRYWDIGLGLSAYVPGGHGEPQKENVLLTSRTYRLAKDRIQRGWRAARRIGLRKQTTRKKPIREADRFQARLSLSPERDELFVELICVNPKPKRWGNGRTVPAGSHVDMATLSDASLSWCVKARGMTLFQSERAEADDEGEVPARSRPVFLDKDQLVGRIVRLSGAPCWGAVEEFFKGNKFPGAKCSIGAGLHFYVPGDDGKPRKDGELTSNEIPVTLKDYQEIAQAAVMRLRQEKLRK